MRDQFQWQEQLGPHARLQAELFKLESHKRELWVLIAFASVVAVLGVLSLLIPGSFWHEKQIEVRLSPQMLFFVMTVVLIVALYMMRREVELRKYRLANIQQLLSARTEQASNMMDAATSVFSRGLLRDLLQSEVARAERNNRPLALMMCDLDNFKTVNDRFGHLMGDYVLAQIGGILKSCVRGSDYVVRYGGDEFLLVLPETNESGAEIVRRRIKEKVAEWNRDSQLENTVITASLGTYLHVAGRSAEEDIAEADARMYADKHGASKPPLPVANITPR